MAKKFNESIEIINTTDNSRRILLEDDGLILVTGKKTGKHSVGMSDRLILFHDDNEKRRITINGGGNIFLSNTSGQTTIHLEGQDGSVFLGDNGADGDIVIMGRNGERRIHLDANKGNMWLGGNGKEGDILIFPSGGNNSSTTQATTHLDGQGNAFLGGNGVDGDIVMMGKNGERRIRLDADYGNMWLGGNGEDGDILIFPSGGDNKTSSQATIHLDGDTGDIKLSGADCAEDFDVLDSEQIEPGSVLVVDREDILQESKKAYDKKVVGVVSGAGDCKPGIILNKNNSQKKKVPVALTGKVYCKVDAQHAPIEVGDLLTTSHTPGHAMKASDPFKAFGAVIGKALRNLKNGQGLIPVLVSLQ